MELSGGLCVRLSPCVLGIAVYVHRRCRMPVLFLFTKTKIFVNALTPFPEFGSAELYNIQLSQCMCKPYIFGSTVETNRKYFGD